MKLGKLIKFQKKNKIPLVIEKTTGEILENLIKDIDHKCRPDLKDPNTEYYKFMDTINNKLIGFVAYDITKKCLYITYICIINAYESQVQVR